MSKQTILQEAVREQRADKTAKRKVVLAWLLALLLLLGIFSPLAYTFVRAEGKQLLRANPGNNAGGTPAATTTAGNNGGDNAGGNNGQAPKEKVPANPVFMGDIELNSVDNAVSGQRLDFVLRFAEVDQNTGNLQAVFGKKIESIYLLESNSADFPFVLNRQAYPAQNIGNATDKQYVYAVFKDLRVKDDVKDGVYELSFRVNYRDVQGQGELQTTILTAYIRMFGFTEASVSDAQVQFKTVNKYVPQARPGQWVPVYLDLANYGLDTVEILNTSLLIDGLPLIIQQADQTAIVERPLLPMARAGQEQPSMENGTMIRVDYGHFQVSKTAGTGTQKISFDITYLDGKKVLKNATVSTYIEVIGGSGSEGKGSMPRIMIGGYKTEPAEVKGGEPFTLKLTLKNTSEFSAVSNMRLNVSSKDADKGQIFMPESGATAFYIKQIPANGSLDYEVKLNSSASLNQKAYPLDITLEYQDDTGNSYTANEQISIYLYQNVRIDFGKIEVSPEEVNVGSEANLFFNIINKGRVKLYNAELVFPEGSPLKADQIFIGDVEPGKTTQVDANVRAESLSMGEPLKFILRYEDENGKESQLEHSFEMNIIEPMPDELPPAFDENGNPIDPGMMDEGMNQGSGFSPWLIVSIIVVILLLILLIVWFLLKRRKKQAKKTIRVRGEEY